MLLGLGRGRGAGDWPASDLFVDVRELAAVSFRKNLRWMTYTAGKEVHEQHGDPRQESRLHTDERGCAGKG